MARVEQDSTIGPHPDVVLYAPTRDLTDTEDIAASSLHPNEGEPPRYDPTGRRPARRRRRRQRALEHPALDLYGGYEGLLVRTALIRSDQYDDRDLPKVETVMDVALLCKHLIHSDQEHVVTIAADVLLHALAINEAAIGPANHASFTAMQVLKVAFLTSARGVFMVHNHPSGDPRPSNDDLMATRAVLKAAECLQLDFLDHIIVGRQGFVSFTQNAPSLAEAAFSESGRHWRRMPWPM